MQDIQNSTLIVSDRLFPTEWKGKESCDTEGIFTCLSVEGFEFSGWAQLLLRPPGSFWGRAGSSSPEARSDPPLPPPKACSQPAEEQLNSPQARCMQQSGPSNKP